MGRSQSWRLDSASNTWEQYRPSQSGGPRANTNANVSTPAGQAIIFGTGAGLIALVVFAVVALVAHLEWWIAIVLALACTMVCGGGFAVWVAVDERRLQWQYSPPDPPAPAPAPAAVVDKEIVYVTDRKGDVRQELATVEPQPVAEAVDLARQKYIADLRFFILHIYATGDSTWETWQSMTMPSGDKLTLTRWQEWCNMLVRARLAERPYARAKLQITSRFADARRALRDVCLIEAPRQGQ